MTEEDSVERPKGWHLPLKTEYIAGALAAYMVGKYLALKLMVVKAPKAIYYTSIGIIDSLFTGE